ncbi:hypothetical protein KFL_014680020 [Klebsormidium nitens]|uniref:Uncharacterized protein n=1 Tax=Klebsormidium nitens TaxID=105231 RepID=A0A1Y1IR78_KLENI|nr:hypothetical protein KFL_014680020 [Klebsormidium nitens]|eukprot:GAQ93360.1 hypothetical protein KFL_014680020 [Klebsormidium nitens]
MEPTISQREVYAKLPIEIAKDISDRAKRREVKLLYRWICDQKRLLEREILVLPRRGAFADYAYGLSFYDTYQDATIPTEVRWYGEEHFSSLKFDELKELSVNVSVDDVDVMSKTTALNMLYCMIVSKWWGDFLISKLRCSYEDAPKGDDSEDESNSEDSDGEDSDGEEDQRPYSEIAKDFFPDSRTLDAFVSMMTLHKKDLATFCKEYEQSRVEVEEYLQQLYLEDLRVLFENQSTEKHVQLRTMQSIHSSLPFLRRSPLLPLRL